MYIDCDSHYFPVKFLEEVSAKYRHSPRVVRNGDDVRSVLPDGTLIKNQAPKGRWHLDTRDQHVDWEGFDVHVLIPENRETGMQTAGATPPFLPFGPCGQGAIAGAAAGKTGKELLSQ